MDERAVVGVDDVAGGAARRTIITGVVVRAEEVERRVEEARLLKAEVDRVRAVERAESARAQTLVGAAGVALALGQSDLGATAPAALEDAEDVARLRNLPARQWVEVVERAHPGARRGRGRRQLQHALG